MKKDKCAFLVSMAIFGTVGIFVRMIPLPSATIACLRGFSGLGFLLIALLIMGKKLDGASIRKNLPILLLSGAAVGSNWMLLFESYRYTTVATATICYYMAPVFLILASPLLGERLTGKKLLLSGIALVGMVFVSGVLKGDGITGGKGILFGVSAALLYASVMFLNQKLGQIEAYDKTVIQLAAAAMVILPYCLLSGGFDMSRMNGQGYLILAVVGIVHTGFAYCLYFGSMGRLSSQTVALFSYLDPVLAILLSALFLREPLDWQGILGAVLILGSAFCSEIPEQKKLKKG